MKIFEKVKLFLYLPSLQVKLLQEKHGEKNLFVCYSHCCIFKFRPRKEKGKEKKKASASLAKAADTCPAFQSMGGNSAAGSDLY